MKQNSAENYEPVNVFLTPDKTPIAVSYTHLTLPTILLV